jgi:hypothetical protein
MGPKASRLFTSLVLGVAITLGLLAVLNTSLAEQTPIHTTPSQAGHGLYRSESAPTVTLPSARTDQSVLASQGQIQSLSNPILAGAVTIDASREGWEQAAPYSPGDPPGDNGGIGNVDWITITMAHDCGDLYVRYEVHDGPSIVTSGARYNLLLDVDRDRATGYRRAGLSFSIGADVLVQGSTVFTFTGTSQEEWSWGEIGRYAVDDRPHSGAKRDIELKVPIADLDVFGDGVTGFDWVAWADHTWGRAPIDIEDCDFYPDGGYGGDAGDFNTYALQSLLPNPERGFYHQIDTHDPFKDTSLAAYQLLATLPGTSTLQCYREFHGTTLIHRNFWLSEYVTRTISAAYLANVRADFATARAAGVKLVVRFAYTPAHTEPMTCAGRSDLYDASKEWILTHTRQLSGVLRANSDVIAAVQAGFIGGWGEWWGSCHFDCDVDCDDCREVLLAVLDMVPDDRMVQVRTPRYKQCIFDTTSPVSPPEAHSGTDFARTGHHNDCFVSSASDYGTTVDPSTEVPYLISDTLYVVMGGETCDPGYASDPAPERRECLTATQELEQFHWSFLNLDWFAPTLQGWRDEGCFDEIEQRLGYRLMFSGLTFPDHVTPGQSIQFSLQIRNEGYAAPYNPRATALVLRHSSGLTHTFKLYDPNGTIDYLKDPRFWLGGETHPSSYSVTVPAQLPLGRYELLLSLPDPALPRRPEYAIRLAGCEWEPSTGYNRLNRSVLVMRFFVYLPLVLKGE